MQYHVIPHSLTSPTISINKISMLANVLIVLFCYFPEYQMHLSTVVVVGIEIGTSFSSKATPFLLLGAFFG